MKRQQAQNLVYWPQKTLNPELRIVTNTNVISDEANKWKAHLVAIAEHRDRKAFHALYCFYAPKLKSFYTNNGFTKQAEEMVQEVFIRVWNRAPTYKPSKSAVSTWIYTIARNYRIDVLRKKQLTIADDENIPESGYEQEMDQEIANERSSSELQDVIAQLDQEQRMVIHKVYFEDKSHQTAAEELGMTLGVVKSRIRSALNLMKQQIGADWL